MPKTSEWKTITLYKIDFAGWRVYWTEPIELEWELTLDKEWNYIVIGDIIKPYKYEWKILSPIKTAKVMKKFGANNMLDAPSMVEVNEEWLLSNKDEKWLRVPVMAVGKEDNIIG